MDLGISGKVAMVAAASKGIGLAVAKLLSAEGCRVSICARTEERLELAAGEVGEETRSYVVDVSNSEDLEWWIDQTRQDLGAPSILVTNTGGPPAGTNAEMTDEQWQLGFDSTLLNVVRLVRLVSPEMTAAKWGRIVHLSSYVAKEPNTMLPISSTLRAGLMGLVRVQSDDLAPLGITVNGVLPGSIMTDRQTHLAEITAEREGVKPEDVLKRRGDAAAVRRIGTPEEVAATVGFLCSEQASYITGINLLVDGGLVRGHG